MKKRKNPLNCQYLINLNVYCFDVVDAELNKPEKFFFSIYLEDEKTHENFFSVSIYGLSEMEIYERILKRIIEYYKLDEDVDSPLIESIKNHLKIDLEHQLQTINILKKTNYSLFKN